MQKSLPVMPRRTSLEILLAWHETNVKDTDTS